MLVRLPGTTLSRQFTTSATSQRSFTLSYTISGADGNTETETYKSAKYFRDTFHGFRFTNPQTGFTYRAADLLEHHVDPTVVYVAKHPFLTARLKEYSHTQIVDKALEDKGCAALECHFQSLSISIQRYIPDKPTRPDSWRLLTGVNDVVEWEGIWESSDGHVFFLEAKHLMDLNKLPRIRHKLTRSLDVLGLDRSKATVYLMGNHWSDGAIEVAQSSLYGFGILTFNGKDLSVRDPLPA